MDTTAILNALRLGDSDSLRELLEPYVKDTVKLVTDRAVSESALRAGTELAVAQLQQRHAGGEVLASNVYDEAMSAVRDGTYCIVGVAKTLVDFFDKQLAHLDPDSDNYRKVEAARANLLANHELLVALGAGGTETMRALLEPYVADKLGFSTERDPSALVLRARSIFAATELQRRYRAEQVSARNITEQAWSAARDGSYREGDVAEVLVEFFDEVLPHLDPTSKLYRIMQEARANVLTYMA